MKACVQTESTFLQGAHFLEAQGHIVHGRLDQVGGAELSDEVHQGVRGSHVPGVESLVSLQYQILFSDYNTFTDF